MQILNSSTAIYRIYFEDDELVAYWAKCKRKLWVLKNQVKHEDWEQLNKLELIERNFITLQLQHLNVKSTKESILSTTKHLLWECIKKILKSTGFLQAYLLFPVLKVSKRPFGTFLSTPVYVTLFKSCLNLKIVYNITSMV